MVPEDKRGRLRAKLDAAGEDEAAPCVDVDVWFPVDHRLRLCGARRGGGGQDVGSNRIIGSIRRRRMRQIGKVSSVGKVCVCVVLSTLGWSFCVLFPRFRCWFGWEKRTAALFKVLVVGIFIISV